MLEHVLDNIATIRAIEHAYVVTNAKFATHFEKWAESYRPPDLHFSFSIVNDQSTDDSNKLGAIGDMHLVMKKYLDRRRHHRRRRRQSVQQRPRGVW